LPTEWAQDFVTFVPAVAYNFSLALPEKFSQLGVNSFGDLCISYVTHHYRAEKISLYVVARMMQAS